MNLATIKITVFNFLLVITVHLGVSIFFIRCNSGTNKTHSTNTSINLKTTFNNRFLDSTILENFISNQDSLKRYRDQFFIFYDHRDFEYAWFDSNGMTEQAHNFFNLQNDLISQLEDSSLYNIGLQQNYDWLNGDDTENKNKYDSISLLEEMKLTGQFFRYAEKIYHGRNLNVQDLGWFIPRKKINITKLLDSLVDGNKSPFAEYEPLNKQYRLLENYLIKYNKLSKNTSWDSIPVNSRIMEGESNARITSIKKRLFLLGDAQELDTLPLYDTEFVFAVKRFQKRFGLTENGHINANTIKKLNLTFYELVQKILVNMERARWMPPDIAYADRIVVNIPDYKLSVYDSGKYSFSMPVVVGTSVYNTVIFSGKISYIVFSPYWNVPTSITKNELIPAMARNKNYLKNNNMEITKYNSLIPEIRQKPGFNNALGKVKFLFPNKYNIYLHDTPNKDVFLKSKRSFSHGCIRIGSPEKLANFLLKRQPAYTTDSIKSLMNQDKEKWVNAKPQVQVVIKYFTAWVDEQGILNFREDIYGLDKKMSKKLF